MIRCVCLLVGLFVCDACCDFSRSTSVIFIEYHTDVRHLSQISLLTFQRSRSKFKVKTPC